MDMIPLDKAAWRARVRARRAADADPFPPSDLSGAPGLGGVLPGAGEWVACYASVPGEPGTSGLLQDLAARELRVALPAPGPRLRSVAWGEVTAATCALPAAAPGRVPEPPGPHWGPEALSRCALVLVPALSVDRSGTRLGQGGGWYDRALAHAAPGALILAVCFPREVHAAGTLPREPHDVPVHGVLTADGVELFGTGADPASGE